MTSTKLVRVAGICAMVAGAIFIGVQIGHPKLNVESITSTEVVFRSSLKILFCMLAVAGITGMYVSQVRRNGTLGLIGYVVLSAGYLMIMASTYASAYVLPSIADTDPSFVKDFIAAAEGKTAAGDLGALGTMIQLQGFAFLAGGLLLGIALFRANVLARWAAVLLAVGGLASVVLSLMPEAFYRLLAFPNGIALIGLGYSLWRWREIVIPESVQSMRAAAEATPARV
jgi:hypothetical protein